jgi:hypothetical protein
MGASRLLDVQSAKQFSAKNAYAGPTGARDATPRCLVKKRSLRREGHGQKRRGLRMKNLRRPKRPGPGEDRGKSSGLRTRKTRRI